MERTNIQANRNNEQHTGYKVFTRPGENPLPLRTYIENARHIVILGHNNPDGDAVGATMAMYAYLKSWGKSSRVVYPNRYAKNLAWMDPDRIAVNFLENHDETAALIAECDLLLIMDFNRVSRAEGLAPLLEDKKAARIMIDHHPEPDKHWFDLGFSNTKISSTCELLYRIFHQELDPAFINPHVCDCLYAGISTDTGSFSYSCAHKELFTTIADLIARGLDTVKVHQRIFDNFAENRMRLLGCCLGERLIVKPEYQTAYMYLTDADMKRYNYQPGDTEGIVNYGLSIAGIRFAAFFTQKEKRIRMSFRSQGDIDVNLFAKEHFGGGGHKNASGGHCFEGMEATIAKFERVLPDFYRNVISRSKPS